MAITNERMHAPDALRTDNDMAAEAGDRVAAMANQAGQTAQEQIDRLAEIIRRKPVQAAGIAAGIGFMLALLARR